MEELNKAAKDLGDNIKIPSFKLDTSSVDDDPFIVKARKWILIGLTGLIAVAELIVIIIIILRKVL